MFARLPRRESHRCAAERKPAARLRRLATAGATVICGLLASAITVPAALAPVPATTVRVVNVGSMAGWRIALIAVGRRPGRKSLQLSCWTGRSPPAGAPRQLPRNRPA